MFQYQLSIAVTGLKPPYGVTCSARHLDIILAVMRLSAHNYYAESCNSELTTRLRNVVSFLFVYCNYDLVNIASSHVAQPSQPSESHLK